jgi:hypothetical protein
VRSVELVSGQPREDVPLEENLGQAVGEARAGRLDIANRADVRLGNIEGASRRRDVGRLERRVGTGLEAGEQRRARPVAILAVDRARVEAERREALLEIGNVHGNPNEGR